MHSHNLWKTPEPSIDIGLTPGFDEVVIMLAAQLFLVNGKVHRSEWNLWVWDLNRETHVDIIAHDIKSHP